MNRKIIIDGYNLIGKFAEFSGYDKNNLEYYRDKLVAMLHQYYYSSKVKIILVFDGDKTGTIPHRNFKKGKIRIKFSNPSQPADRLIENLIEKCHKEDIEVVTSDNRIINHARKFKVPVTKSLNFYKRLIKHPSQSSDTGDEKEPFYNKDEDFYRKIFGVD